MGRVWLSWAWQRMQGIRQAGGPASALQAVGCPPPAPLPSASPPPPHLRSTHLACRRSLPPPCPSYSLY